MAQAAVTQRAQETETKMMLPESSFCVTENLELTKMMSDELPTDLDTVNL